MKSNAITAICCLLAVGGSGNALAAPLRVGFAVADISPPAVYRMAGNYNEVMSDGVRDPLFAKAMSIEDGDVKACIIICDVCGHERGLTDEARATITAKTGIPIANIAITATHTHGGPMHYDPVLLKLYRDRIGAKDDASDPVERSSGYRKKFVAGIVEAAVAAQKAARPATFDVGSIAVPGIAFNRRYFMKDGNVRCNPGKRNPGIVKVAGPTNDLLPILLATDAGSGKAFGCLSAFDMHTAVYGGSTFSACYPGHMQRKLHETYGKDFISIFGEGCAGDTNHIDVHIAERDPTPEIIGAKLAAKLIEAVPKLKPMAGPLLQVKRGNVAGRLRADRPKEYEVSRDRLIGEAAKKAEFLEQVEAYRVLLVRHYRERHGDAVPLEIQAFRLGSDTAIVTLPHEVFVEIGMQIRRESPFPNTIIVTLANEVDCYVPTKKAFVEGSYEVTNSPYEPGIGEALADEAVRLLKDFAK